jgi:GTP-binding protein HflX
VQEADVVLHVRDVFSEESAAQAADVAAVLEQIGAGLDSSRAIIEVWNKIDLLPTDEREQALARSRRREGSGAPIVAVSAISGEGCEHLVAFLAELVDQGVPVAAHLLAQDGEAMAWLYRHGRVLSRADDEAGGVELQVQLDAQALGQFERLFPQAFLREAAE